ncbi:LysE type translocator [Desulfofundulus australicus DSM 11792]|uniref:LysE type translocator n=1 Tax=Desulfofundulus australicus DSM 11792 TaxID=1121425 RepID=A0A1M4S7V2_9FIRM|nr:LysE type translocator [Desulfofundulus australicus DSM 11792]
MELVAIFSTAFVVGLSGAMMPGPLLTVTIGESARRGFAAGPLVVLGHALLEGALVVALSLGLASLITAPPVARGIAVVGGIFLIYLGWGMARDAWLGRVELGVERAGPEEPGCGSRAGGVRCGCAGPSRGRERRLFPGRRAGPFRHPFSRPPFPREDAPRAGGGAGQPVQPLLDALVGHGGPGLHSSLLETGDCRAGELFRRPYFVGSGLVQPGGGGGGRRPALFDPGRLPGHPGVLRGFPDFSGRFFHLYGRCRARDPVMQFPATPCRV